ncbi:hypothetical protein [Halalkalibacter krulwichiae]|uniref:Uncharacterized protein n=1 Tax=Halalkalibacter krulwichiae TaxID=199441 RepID=A0A1X9MBQ9_9BACI|nr:hypothetical protein [Halalkalibacter krulwichiae]ARK30846.1 hypothetical protein BkAM31D_13910 [Halalkalibacter krulwichiae]
MRQKQKQVRKKITNVFNSNSIINKGILLVCIALSVVVIYNVVQSEVFFRSFVVLFLIGATYYLNRKINQLKGIPQQEQNLVVEEKIEDQQTQIFEKTVTEKEQQLEKIDLDRTQMLEELFTKAELNDLEKQTYRERIKQKESERSDLVQDLLIVKGKLQQAVLETKKYFVKADPMKEIAASIESDKLEHANMASLNKEVQLVISSSLSEQTVQALLKGNYVDEEYNLTRSGYKALVKTLQNK